MVNTCLINVLDLDAHISSIIAHPELHYLIGIVNWIFNLVRTILGTDRYELLGDWGRHRGVTIHRYQGRGLDVNNSKKFLSCSKELEQLLPENAAMPAIIDLLAKFDRVVTGCFSYELSPDYIKRMDHFINLVWELIY